MVRRAWLWLLMACAPVALAAPTAAELAARMREARLSSGFEVRLRAVDVSPDERRSEPARIAVIGQFERLRRRILLRGIAPEAISGQSRVAEYLGGCVRAADRHGAADPYTPLFGTSLVAWDMLAPWWEWPHQSIAGRDRVAGRDCILVRSRSEERDAPVREVLSCVDSDAGLSLSTRMFDRHGALVRSTTVMTTMRKESGLLAASKVEIATGHRRTEAESYSGDEHYEVAAGAFAPLDGETIPCRP